MMNNENKECRICFEEELSNNKLINPCLCNGTSKYVHIHCLNQWRNSGTNQMARIQCSECKYNYRIVFLHPSEVRHLINIQLKSCLILTYVFPFLLFIFINVFDINRKFNVIDTLYIDTEYYRGMRDWLTNKNNTILYHLVFINYLFYIQQIIFYSIFNIKIITSLHKENITRYYGNKKYRLLLELFNTFKFIILYTFFVSIEDYFFNFSFLFSFLFLEPLIYFAILNCHDYTIYNLENNNPERILEYDEDLVEQNNIVHFERLNRYLRN